jgi:hypothetical protein
MMQVSMLVIALLFTQVLTAETASTEKIVNIEESDSSDSSYGDVSSPWDQDMHLSDPDGGKMSRTKKGATWTGKRGNVDISVSIDNIDPHAEFKSEWSKKSKDDSKKKRRD